MFIYWVGNYDHFVSDNGGEIGAADKHVLGANLDRAYWVTRGLYVASLC